MEAALLDVVILLAVDNAEPRLHAMIVEFADWWALQIRAGEVMRWRYLVVPTAPIDERDIAAVAMRALSEDRHVERKYVLTGPSIAQPI